MAEPIPFKEQNMTLGRGDNHASVTELPIHRYRAEDIGTVNLSCWRLTVPEIEEVQRTGVVWVGVLGRTQPPIYVRGTTPFASPTAQGGE